MKKRLNLIYGSILVWIMVSCQIQKPVETGLDQISEFSHLFKNKRIGIITNHTAYNLKNENIIDIFSNQVEAKINALFGPEHGIHGENAAGEKVADQIDTDTKIPIYSLYGKTLKPTPEMLQNIDVLVFDIQDIGARFYTYIHTMSLAMEAAAENNITFVVLDRPNPINGIDIEGNILEREFATFVGLYPIPVRHGMTVGELASMINGEGWLKNHVEANLYVVPMKGWMREFWFDNTGLKWRPPSPNIPDLNVATVYPGTCLFEGTNISEGRGTYKPFLVIGTPWFYNDQFSMINKLIDLPGVQFGPISFTPISIPNMAPEPKYINLKLTGVSLFITDRKTFRPYLTGIALVKFLYEIDKRNFKWNTNHFDRLCGSNRIREFITKGKTVEDIKFWIDQGLADFKQIRTKYLLY